MSEKPSPIGSSSEPESQHEPEETPTQEIPIPEVEVQPPNEMDSGTAQHLPSAPRQPWISRVWGGRSRRDQQLQTLQSGYVEMLDMMRSITGHLDRQAMAQDHLMKTLDHFPEAVDGLRNVGKATEQQTEVLGMVRSQLEANANHEREIVKSMEGFNQTLSLMDETSRNTTATIGDLMESSRDSEDELRSMLERSEKRLTVLTAALGIFGMLAIGGAVFVGLSQRPAATAQQGESGQATIPQLMADVEEPAPTDLDIVADDTVEQDLDEVVGDTDVIIGATGEEFEEMTEAAPVESPTEFILDAEIVFEDAMEEAMGDATESETGDMAEIELAETTTDSGEDAGITATEASTDALDPTVEESAEVEETPAAAMDEDAGDTVEDAGATAEDAAAADEDAGDTDENAGDAEAFSGDSDQAETGESAPAPDEPAGVKNVVRDFFSFLGDEEPEEAAAGVTEGVPDAR